MTYIQQMVPALVEVGAGHEFHVLLSGRSQQALIGALPRGARPLVADIPGEGILRRLWYEQVMLRRELRRRRFDLLLTVADVGMVRAPCPHVAMARNPNIYAPLWSAVGGRHRRMLLAYRLTRQPLAYLTLRAADRVVFVSEAFQQEVLRTLRLDPRRARIVHHGVAEAFRRDESRAEGVAGVASALGGRAYLLAVSTIAPHKNYETLIDAFATVTQDDACRGVDLAIAGGVSYPAVFDALRERARALGVGERIHFLGRVSYEQLPGLYRRARAFIFPSRLETFGHPLVEAMASGVPVIASSLPVCREICGAAALYFDPARPQDLADHVIALLSDAGLRTRLRAGGIARAAEFSWGHAARAMVGIFEDVAGR